MPSRADSAVLSLIEETAVRAEAAEAEFVRISEEVRKTVRESCRLTEKTLLQQDRARRQVIEAHARLSNQLRRRDPKSVAACYCKGRLWVCQNHPAIALDECPCGAASVPCCCNPSRSAPPGYHRFGATQSWNWPRSIHVRRAKSNEEGWYDVSDAIRPNDGERALVREHRDGEPTLVLFRATPVERWLSPDSIYPFKFFAQWRRLSNGPAARSRRG
jgi:hypothetical protein